MPAVSRAPTRHVRTSTMDSRRWDDFPARNDDIVVATYPKCGTTWTQRIVDRLVFQSPEPREFLAASPWLDATFFAPHEVNLATLEAQTHRRCIKSHLPFDALPVFEGVKYIHTVRDGRDACLSMHNHQLGFLPEARARVAEQTPEGAVAAAITHQTPTDPRAFFLQWMDTAEGGRASGDTDLPFCEFEQTYWRHRADPNVLHVHYADLKADLEGEMARIATFLGIDTPNDLMPELAQAARFDTMKSQGEQLMPMMRMAFDNGSQRFLNQGLNGRWKGVLTEVDLARYDALVQGRLSAAHDAWIRNGRLIAGDPATLPG